MIKGKTLVLTENYPPVRGGSSRWFYELYRRLGREKYLVATNETALDIDQFEENQLNTYRFNLSSKEWGIKSFVGLRFYWNSVKTIFKLIRTEKITSIHCGRVIHEGVIAWILSFITRIEYLCFVHGEDVEVAATSREHALLVKQVCKRAKLIICNSENSAKIVTRLGFATREKIRVLHPGVDTDKFRPAEPDPEFREKMGWTGKRVILTVGRLQERKGQDRMIEAMVEVRKSIKDARYAIVGNGEDYERLSKLITLHQLEDIVTIYPNMTDEQMLKCYQQCDLFILPNRAVGSDIEGFGMVLLEAQACGKFVIAGNSGGTNEAILNESSGKVIDCNIVAKIAETINDSLRFSHIDSFTLAEHVKNKFSWQTSAEKSKEIFQK